jgi:uncharacterized protein
MSAEALLRRTAAHVQQALAGDSSGHDFWHIQRVWRLAVEIGRAEGADLLVVQLAALLHDLADWKFHGGDLEAGPRAARQWLEHEQVDPTTTGRVVQVITEVSFRGAGVSTTPSTLEGRVVQDADRLDALGAIGVARAFAYGGHRGRPLYDPATPPQPHASFDAYRGSAGPTINHFYEKLLLLKDRLQTAAARRLAEPRHAFLEQFLAQFFAEWGDPAAPAPAIDPVQAAGGPSISS